MKKGDIVSRENVLESGSPRAHNFTTRELAEAWMRRNHEEGQVVPDTLNEGKLMVISEHSHLYTIEAEVQWVIENEAALKFRDGSFKIIDIDEDNWKVIREGIPTYQSSVAGMTDEQLRESIDTLRQTRITPPKVRVQHKGRGKGDPILDALAKMDPIKKRELMKKLGMVE